MNTKNKESNYQIDFHMHSTCSDGADDVATIISLALKQENLRTICVTDHNYFALTRKLMFGTNDRCLEVLPGCEFSTSYMSAAGKWNEIHVIGIFPKGVNPSEFEDLFEPIAKGKKKYVEAIVNKLQQQFGIDITLEEVLATKKQSTGYVGRFQIAQLLVEKGAASTVDRAMDIYIGNFSPHYISPVPDYIKYPAFETVIKRILSLSGMPVLCHPCSYYGFDDDDVIRLVNDFRKACGGTGAIEVYYQNYTKEQQKFLQGLQEKAGLIPSVASDRHRRDQHFADYGGYSFYKKMLQALEQTEK